MLNPAPDYFETMQTLQDVETLRQAGLSVETEEDYKEFRDSLFRPELANQKHTHHAYYDDDGKLMRMCAICHLDLCDDVHVAESRC